MRITSANSTHRARSSSKDMGAASALAEERNGGCAQACASPSECVPATVSPWRALCLTPSLTPPSFDCNGRHRVMILSQRKDPSAKVSLFIAHSER